jgi:hypothetical protein
VIDGGPFDAPGEHAFSYLLAFELICAQLGGERDATLVNPVGRPG